MSWFHSITWYCTAPTSPISIRLGCLSKWYTNLVRDIFCLNVGTLVIFSRSITKGRGCLCHWLLGIFFLKGMLASSILQKGTAQQLIMFFSSCMTTSLWWNFHCVTWRNHDYCRRTCSGLSLPEFQGVIAVKTSLWSSVTILLNSNLKTLSSHSRVHL